MLQKKVLTKCLKIKQDLDFAKDHALNLPFLLPEPILFETSHWMDMSTNGNLQNNSLGDDAMRSDALQLKIVC